MRTTLDLDHRLLAQAKLLAQQTGATLNAVIEDALRERLAQRQAPSLSAGAVANGRGDGMLPGIDLDDSAVPEPSNLAKYLVPASELGTGYEGTAEPAGPRDRRARAFADSPVGPAVVQVLAALGSPERATEEALSQAVSAGEGGATEVRMAVTAGKRIFVRGGGDTQEMGVVTSKGPFVVTVFLDFAGLPDNGGRTELAVKITELLLARLPT